MKSILFPIKMLSFVMTHLFIVFKMKFYLTLSLLPSFLTLREYTAHISPVVLTGRRVKVHQLSPNPSGKWTITGGIRSKARLCTSGHHLKPNMDTLDFILALLVIWAIVIIALLIIISVQGQGGPAEDIQVSIFSSNKSVNVAVPIARARNTNTARKAKTIKGHTNTSTANL